MYSYLDRQVTMLAEPDRFLLAAIRHWVEGAATGRCACAVLAGGFARRGIAGAARDFATAMLALDLDGIAAMKFGRPGTVVVTDDEARLLAVFAAARQGDKGALGRIAPTLVSAEAAGRFSTAVLHVGTAIAEGARA